MHDVLEQSSNMSEMTYIYFVSWGSTYPPFLTHNVGDIRIWLFIRKILSSNIIFSFQSLMLTKLDSTRLESKQTNSTSFAIPFYALDVYSYNAPKTVAVPYIIHRYFHKSFNLRPLFQGESCVKNYQNDNFAFKNTPCSKCLHTYIHTQ